MISNDVLPLSLREGDGLVRSSPPKRFKKDSVLVYRGHVPNVCLLLLEGEVQIGGVTKEVQPEGRESLLIGFQDLLERRQAKEDLKVLKNSKISVIDRDLAKNIHIGLS